MSDEPLFDIPHLTDLLRTSDDQIWRRLRALMTERGVDIPTSVLVEFFTDDCEFEFGIVLTRNGSVFQFGFDHLRKPISEGVLRDWADLTTRYPQTPHRSSVEAGLPFLRAGAG